MFEITVLSLFPHTFSHTCCQNRVCLRLRLYFRRPQARPRESSWPLEAVARP